MKKDIKWLVQMINAEREALRQRIETGRGTPNENTFNEGRDRALAYVLRMMQHLDKSEVLSQELPVIPKYVAEYLEFAKSDVPLMRILEIANTRDEWPRWRKEYDWISVNDETFARAWLDGYEVEEEQKYCVNDGKNILLCKWESPDGWKVISTVESANRDLRFGELDFRLTEHEIKEYDPRYWEFRKSVDAELYDA